MVVFPPRGCLFPRSNGTHRGIVGQHLGAHFFVILGVISFWISTCQTHHTLKPRGSQSQRESAACWQVGRPRGHIVPWMSPLWGREGWPSVPLPSSLCTWAANAQRWEIKHQLQIIFMTWCSKMDDLSSPALPFTLLKPGNSDTQKLKTLIKACFWGLLRVKEDPQELAVTPEQPTTKTNKKAKKLQPSFLGRVEGKNLFYSKSKSLNAVKSHVLPSQCYMDQTTA